MSFTQDIAMNTLWYSASQNEVPDASDPNAISGAVAINTADGKMWVKVTGGDVTGGWELVSTTSGGGGSGTVGSGAAYKFPFYTAAGTTIDDNVSLSGVNNVSPILFHPVANATLPTALTISVTQLQMGGKIIPTGTLNTGFDFGSVAGWWRNIYGQTFNLQRSHSGSYYGVTLAASATTATYPLTFPAAAPTNGQALQSDGSGNFSWVTGPSSNALNMATHLADSTPHSAYAVTLTGTQTLTNKTLTTPTISSTGFTNAQHAHVGATSGGAITTSYTHPSYNGDDFNLDTGHLSGAYVVDDIDINVTTDASGHVTDANGTVATRQLTASDIGAAASDHGTHADTTYSAGTYLDLSGTTFNVDLNEVSLTTTSSVADRFFVESDASDTAYRIAAGNIAISTFNNDAGFITSASSHPDPHRLGNGTAAAPTYSFSAETNSGFYREAYRKLGLVTNGQGQTSFDGNSGRLGLRIDSHYAASSPSSWDYPSVFYGVESSHDRDTGFNYYNSGTYHGTIFISNGTTAAVIGYGSSTYKMYVNGGLSVSGALSKGSGSFKIAHPLDEANKTLVHGFIESPRHDLVYRGTATLSSGTVTASIDTASSMTSGTFAALTKNPEIWVQNKTGWTAVRGQVSGGNVVITAQDSSCTDTVAWLVMAERNDTFIRSGEEPWTDNSGNFIPEWTNSDLKSKGIDSEPLPR